MNHPQNVEIRVRLKGDTRPWTDIPPEEARLRCATIMQAERLVTLYAVQTIETDWTEIRWNWLGSLQGHYIQNERTQS